MFSASQDTKKEPACKLLCPVDGDLTVEVMFADVLGQDVRCLIATDARSKRLVEVSAAVAKPFAYGVQDAAGIDVVFEADRRSSTDRQLLAATLDDTEVKVGSQTVAQEAFFLLGVVERVEATAEAERCRRQLLEHGCTALFATSSQMLATADVAAATTSVYEHQPLNCIVISWNIVRIQTRNYRGVSKF